MPRLKLLTILLLCATGCAPGGGPTGPSDAALCDGLEAATRDHAAALAEDGGDRSVVTGARLIRALDAGCGRAE
jgi:hypothetical protein